MAGHNTFDPLSLRQRLRMFRPRNNSSESSTSTIKLTATELSELAKPSVPESVYSLDSTTFGSTPSLSLSWVKSTETLELRPDEKDVCSRDPGHPPGPGEIRHQLGDEEATR